MGIYVTAKSYSVERGQTFDITGSRLGTRLEDGHRHGRILDLAYPPGPRMINAVARIHP